MKRAVVIPIISLFLLQTLMGVQLPRRKHRNLTNVIGLDRWIFKNGDMR